jgi:inosose dehydratase
VAVRGSRRQFLLSVAGASLLALRHTAAAFERGGDAVGRDGVALYWFTQLAERQGKPLRDLLPRYLAMTAEAGFSCIEGWLTDCETDESAAALADLVKAPGLAIAGLYSGGALHAENAGDEVRSILDRAARAKRIGCPGISLNPDPIGREKTDAELATQASALDDLSAGLREMGLWLGIHTHSPEMTHNAREFRSNLDRTSPDNVGLCADFHWIYRGGGDPYAITERYADRIVTTHLRNSVEAVWAESFCEGDLDYGRIASLLQAVGYKGPLCVELALEPRTPDTRTPQENLKLSRAYLRQVFGV